MLQEDLPSLCLDPPSYKYHYGPIVYFENRYNRELTLGKHLRHDILEARQSYTSTTCLAWRNALRVKDVY